VFLYGGIAIVPVRIVRAVRHEPTLACRGRAHRQVHGLETDFEAPTLLPEPDKRQGSTRGEAP